MIDIKIDEDSLLHERTTAEFEYKLENFFAHRHPIKQTHYIICWTLGRVKMGTHYYGEKGLYSHGSMHFELKQSDKFYNMHFDDHVINIIALEKLPGIKLAT